MTPGGLCAAVLDVDALDLNPAMPLQTWHCKATRSAVLMVNGPDRFGWAF